MQPASPPDHLTYLIFLFLGWIVVPIVSWKVLSFLFRNYVINDHTGRRW